MAKVPVNRIKKASKVAYLGVRSLAKVYAKVSVPIWSRSPEAERDALMAVGKMLFAGVTPTEGQTEADALLAVLKAVPDVSPNSVVGFLISDNPLAASAFAVYVHTVRVLI